MNEQMTKILQMPWVIPTSVGVASFSAGLGIGLWLGKRNKFEIIHVSTKKTEEQDISVEVEFEATEEDIEAVRTGLPDGRKKPDPRDLSVDPVLQPLLEEHMSNGGKMTDFLKEHNLGSDNQKDNDEEEAEIVNIFASSSADEWDYEKEVAGRDSDEPYILHRDEYFEDENGYSQTTLTYYEGDDILTDSEDTPIYGHEALTGPMSFGHGSDDPNTFYVRNEKLKADYEILRDPGMFSKIVLGLDADEEVENEIKHSHSSLRKFRPDD